MNIDVQMQNDVMEELKWEPSVTASELGVSAESGVVTLSGTVPTFVFYTVASFPVACGLSIVLAWLLYARQKYRAACLITLLPFASLILIGIGWNLDW